jgi:predicted GIY-YIG superfamily endonuclease
MYFVYAILSVSKNRIYIGQTREMKQRLQYYNSGRVKSTKEGVPWQLIALQEVEDRDKARWIERGLKQSEGRRKKWLASYAYGSESEISE